MKRLSAFLLALTTLLPASQTPAWAEAAYPSRPLRIVIPFPPGSGTDSATRFIAQELSQITGQPVVVDNKAGANGFIAAQAAAQAAPDGYTVFLTTMTTQSVNPHIYKKLPYDPLKDFAPVALLSKAPMLLVVRNEEGQPKSLEELTAKAKRSPGKMSFASGNMSSRVAGEVYGRQIGANLLHVPYRGTPQGITALLAGEVDLIFPDLTPSVPLVRSGKLRALGVTGTRRLSTLPDVKTMEEQGYPGLDLVAWGAVYLPARTPAPIVQKLSELILQILHSPAAKEYYSRFGSELTPLPPKETAAFVKTELENWGRAVRSAGIEPE